MPLKTLAEIAFDGYQTFCDPSDKYMVSFEQLPNDTKHMFERIASRVYAEVLLRSNPTLKTIEQPDLDALLSGKNITAEVSRIIREQVGDDQADTSSQSKLMSVLEGDELGLVEIVLELEGTFGIDIDDDATLAWHTVGDIIDYLTKQRQQ